MKRLVSLLVLITFCFSNLPSSLVFAQTVNLPAPGTMVSLSAKGDFPLLKGLRLNPDNPLKMDFIIEPNGASSVTKEDAALLARYFLAALAMPKQDTWVNLSPYESQRIVPEAMADTDLGKDLLGQDYILKQLASSLTYPETETGKAYWQSIQSADSPKISVTNKFNKVWIIPNKSSVYENGNTVLISESTLAVKTEEDYLAIQSNRSPGNLTDITPSTSAFKQYILPLIEKDVNTGKNFAQLRQIYSALILAEWFKNKFFDSFYHNYINQAKTKGITIDEKGAKDKIYALYLEAFKKGAYNYIKKERVGTNNYSPVYKITKRQYFSGGFADDPISVKNDGAPFTPPSTTLDAQVELGTYAGMAGDDELQRLFAHGARGVSASLTGQQRSAVKARLKHILFNFLDASDSRQEEWRRILQQITLLEDLEELLGSQLVELMQGQSDKDLDSLLLALAWMNHGKALQDFATEYPPARARIMVLRTHIISLPSLSKYPNYTRFLEVAQQFDQPSFAAKDKVDSHGVVPNVNEHKEYSVDPQEVLKTDALKGFRVTVREAANRIRFGGDMSDSGRGNSKKDINIILDPGISQEDKERQIFYQLAIHEAMNMPGFFDAVYIEATAAARRVNPKLSSAALAQYRIYADGKHADIPEEMFGDSAFKEYFAACMLGKDAAVLRHARKRYFEKYKAKAPVDFRSSVFVRDDDDPSSAAQPLGSSLKVGSANDLKKTYVGRSLVRKIEEAKSDQVQVPPIWEHQGKMYHIGVYRDEIMQGYDAIYLRDSDTHLLLSPPRLIPVIAVQESIYESSKGTQALQDLFEAAIASDRQPAATKKTDTQSAAASVIEDPATFRPNGQKDEDIEYLDHGMPHGSISDPALPRYFEGFNSHISFSYHAWSEHSPKNRRYALLNGRDKWYVGFQHYLFAVSAKTLPGWAFAIRSRLDAVKVMEDDELAMFEAENFYEALNSSSLGFTNLTDDFSAPHHRDPKFYPERYLYPRFARAAVLAAFVLKAPVKTMAGIITGYAAERPTYKAVLEALQYYVNCLADNVLPQELADAVDPEILNHLYYAFTHKRANGDINAMRNEIVAGIKPFLDRARNFYGVKDIKGDLAELLAHFDGTRQDLGKIHTPAFVPGTAKQPAASRQDVVKAAINKARKEGKLYLLRQQDFSLESKPHQTAGPQNTARINRIIDRLEGISIDCDFIRYAFPGSDRVPAVPGDLALMLRQDTNILLAQTDLDNQSYYSLLAKTDMDDRDYHSSRNYFICLVLKNGLQGLEEMSDRQIAEILFENAVKQRIYGMQKGGNPWSDEKEAAAQKMARDMIVANSPKLDTAFGQATPSGAAKRPGLESAAVSEALRQKLLDDTTEGFVAVGHRMYSIDPTLQKWCEIRRYKDTAMPGYDAVYLGEKELNEADLLGSGRQQFIQRRFKGVVPVIAVSESAFAETEGLPFLLRHDIDEQAVIKVRLALATSLDGGREVQPAEAMINQEHRIAAAKEVLAWCAYLDEKKEGLRLLPRHLRAIKEPGRAKELTSEWQDSSIDEAGRLGWLATHAESWRESGFDPAQIKNLEAYALLFNKEAVGGEDFRGLDTKTSGNFAKMELKGTNFQDLSDLNVEITAIVPFRP